MRNFLEKLKMEFPFKEFKENDIDILENCIDGIYTENDFIHACKQLFKNKQIKTISSFKNKEVFIRFRNMNRENFPNWLNDLSFDDQFDIKENYKIIVGYCLGDWNQYNCNHEDILAMIYEYHKQAIPFWCISAYIQEALDTTKGYLKKYKLLEIMNRGDDFKKGCRAIFKRQKLFKEKLKKEGINFIEAIENKNNAV